MPDWHTAAHTLTVLTFIDASSRSQGVPESFSSYLVSIANAGNAVGRLSSGIFADKFGMTRSFPPTYLHLLASRSLGPMNIMIPASLFTGVLTVIWPNVRGKGALVT